VKRYAQHDGAARQGRLDAGVQMVAACGEDQQRLAQCVHRLVQHQLAQLFGQGTAAGFARQQHLVPLADQPGCRAVMCVDLPAPSMPSKVMKRPLMAHLALVLVHRTIMVGQVVAEDTAAIAAGHEVQRLAWAWV